MINQELINEIESASGEVDAGVVMELLSDYKQLIKDNAALHKELSALRGDKVFVCNSDSKNT